MAPVPSFLDESHERARHSVLTSYDRATPVIRSDLDDLSFGQFRTWMLAPWHASTTCEPYRRCVLHVLGMGRPLQITTVSGSKASPDTGNP